MRFDRILMASVIVLAGCVLAPTACDVQSTSPTDLPDDPGATEPVPRAFAAFLSSDRPLLVRDDAELGRATLTVTANQLAVFDWCLDVIDSAALQTIPPCDSQSDAALAAGELLGFTLPVFADEDGNLIRSLFVGADGELLTASVGQLKITSVTGDPGVNGTIVRVSVTARQVREDLDAAPLVDGTQPLIVLEGEDSAATEVRTIAITRPSGPLTASLAAAEGSTVAPGGSLTLRARLSGGRPFNVDEREECSGSDPEVPPNASPVYNVRWGITDLQGEGLSVQCLSSDDGQVISTATYTAPRNEDLKDQLPGNVVATIEVSDAAGNRVSSALPIIVASKTALVVADASSEDSRVAPGKSVELTAAGTGGEEPYTISFAIVGEDPLGRLVRSRCTNRDANEPCTGEYEAPDDEVGAVLIRVTIVDFVGATATETIPLSIASPQALNVLAFAGTSAIPLGQSTPVTAEVSGGTPPYTVCYDVQSGGGLLTAFDPGCDPTDEYFEDFAECQCDIAGVDADGEAVTETLSLTFRASNVAGPVSIAVRVKDNVGAETTDVISLDVSGGAGSACGDGTKQGSEQCDDSNTLSGDGCTSSCTLELGWTCNIAPCTPICGDGLLRGTEQCDGGDCCTGTCTYAAVGTACGDVAPLGDCDEGDTCDASGVCVVNLKPATEECRASAGVCDIAEFCTGSSADCPADVLDDTSECRPAAGVCDIAESCDGVSADCPADVIAASGAPCRAAVDACDLPEECDGASTDCPADALAPVGAFCGDATLGECTAPDTCDGAGLCLDNHAIDGLPCADDGNDCTTDACSSGICTHVNLVAGTPCDDPTSSTCNGPDTCDGFGNCLANYTPAGWLCGVTSTDCEDPETCDGAGVCVKNYKPLNTECGDVTPLGVCDKGDKCDGAGNCLVNNEPGSMVCRLAAGPCDVEEFCHGNSPNCPSDDFLPDTTECRSAVDVCDAAEYCTGSSADCPADALEPLITECRVSAGVCDPAEFCDGVSTGCPADLKSTDECRVAVEVCDAAEFCDGIGNDCPADALQPSTTECRPSVGVCDTADFCDGLTPACPADLKSTAECRAVGGVCDVAEFCDGIADDCPVDEIEPTSTECRTAVGDCDVAEYCDGLTVDCPTDVFQPELTACGDPSTTECTDPDTCDAFGNCLGNHALDDTPCTDDGAECTADACETGECVHTPYVDFRACDFVGVDDGVCVALYDPISETDIGLCVECAVDADCGAGTTCCEVDDVIGGTCLEGELFSCVP
ncbi:MAG: hypothetical protein JSU63_11665 [Phycisphaerales bacterium]|nr:MAG: hypothetical protein JSU63_11665 [Phycisphaerales bacterium]